VVIGLACWWGYADGEAAAREEERVANRYAASYLDLVIAGDATVANAMLCGGDNMIIRADTMRDVVDRRVTSARTTGGGRWSSIDGHGWSYSVVLTFSDGSTGATEIVLSMIGDRPCIATELPA